MDLQCVTCCLLLVYISSEFVYVLSATVGTLKTNSSISSNPKSRRGDHEPLHFPSEPQENGSLNRGGPSLDDHPSPCADGALFCESSTDYPKDFIKSKLKKQPKLLLDILYEEEIGDDVHNKFGPESEEIELCTSTAKIVYPDKGQSKEGVLEFIVNDDEYKQGVRVETCTSNEAECNMMPAHVLPLGYKSRCVQKYILRTLVVLNRNSSSDVQGFVTKPFEFPSCCSCVIKMSTSGHNRFGGDLEPDTTPVTATNQPTDRPKGTPKSVDKLH